ncbi:penicillin-binding protein [Actinomadura montaniterrae]|uniref:Penicillin-binding protein n=1 Tax=Actinomadura montaniterrae TaxID=1803903 RepID=A0A6L3VTN6_9ACTN|nr:penicillin-binding protein [Actinomadura montaniterrae]
MAILGIATLVGVAYANTPIPKARQADVTKQASVITYDDGKSTIARVGMNREILPLKDIPEVVQHAVLAAEDREFYNEPGISPSGIAGALYRAATGGDVNGASTITQQLARNYYQGLSQKRTVSRKLKEILISVRMGNEKSKDWVLEQYLNTVFFGRDAYGVQAASRAYFHKPVKDINASQAALLAAMIQRPTYFKSYGSDSDPAKQALIARWNYVISGMEKKQWLTPDEKAKAKFPQTYKKWSDIKDTGQTGYLTDRVISELATLGISKQRVQTAGLRIRTTFDKDLQDYTATAVKQLKDEKNFNSTIHFGLTVVDPKTGGVIAAYGGPSYEKQQFDDSFQGAVQPGSSFKPIVLATALDNDVSLKTTMDGHYRRIINGTPFTNDSRSENGVFDLKEMTAKSINTAYVDLGQKVGLDKVVDMAEKMGIPSNTPGLNATYTSLPLGVIDATSVTMAGVYQTFAAGGVHRPAHVIQSITDANGNPVLNDAGKPVKKEPWGKKDTQVFSAGVAADATEAMRGVVTHGTGTGASLGSRPVAGKTGTSSQNKSAWFVGYTPELVTAASMWRQDKKGNRLSLVGVGGYSQVYGGTVPAELFKMVMTKALEGKEITPFPPPVYGGTVAPWAVAKPEPTTSPTNSPSPTNTPTCGNNGQGQGQNGRPCPGKTPNPTNTPTAPTTEEPCNGLGLPPGCNPNLPPTDPAARKQWCKTHPENSACKEQDPTTPNGTN